MADKYWVGGTDGDWNTAGNWSPALVPVAGEDVYITGRSTQAIDAYDNSGVAIGNLYIDESYTKKIGDYGSGTPVYLKLAFGSGKKISIRGDTAAQQCWIEAAGSNSVDVHIRDWGTVATSSIASQGVHIKETGTGTVTVYQHGGTLVFDSGGITTMIQTGGTSQITTSSTFGTLRVAGDAAVCDVQAGTVPTTMEFASGTVTMGVVDGSGASVVMFAGECFWTGGSDLSSLLKVYGGTFRLRPSHNRAIIADVELYGDSIFDMGTPHGCTVTNNIKTYGNATIISGGESTMTYSV